MPDTEAIRREVDPLWDINPLEARCSVAEVADILLRVGHYLEHEASDQPFSPILIPITQSLTLATFGIADRSIPTSPTEIGQIEARKTGSGCRLVFELTRTEFAGLFRGVYRVVRNALMRDDLLCTAGDETSGTRPTEAEPQAKVDLRENEPESVEHVEGRKFGSCGDLSLDEVREIVKRCRAWRKEGGKLPAFYDKLNINPGEPKSFEKETLRSWLKNPKFS